MEDNIEIQKEIICPNCGTKNKATSRFCENCGSVLNITVENENQNIEETENTTKEEEKEKKCPKCGTVVGNAQFCPNCGYNTNKKPNIWLKCLIWAIIILGGLIGCIKYQEYQEMIAPYKKAYNFGDTKTYINVTYNPEYKSASFVATIDETIEEWQIQELGTSISFKLIYKGVMGDNTYEFKNVILEKGKTIKGQINYSNYTPKSFNYLKDILRTSDVTINYPKPLEMDSKERAKLKKEYYKRLEEQKRSEQQLDAMGALGAMMLFGSMF